MSRATRRAIALAVLAAVSGAPRPVQAQGAGQTYLLVVSGVSGEKRFGDTFHAWGMALLAAGTTKFGIPAEQMAYLAEDSTRDARRIRGRSTKANVETTLMRMASQAREGDRLVVVLFGHGSAQGAEPRFNLPGPDMTAADFARVLAPARATVVFVNTASASGDFVKALSAKNRVIITATKSAREQNETYFPQHFVEALTGTAGDADKDGRVSILEAFTYARREVERLFEQGNRIASEHPQLDDDGDGVGHGDASDKGPDGRRSRTLYLEPLGGVQTASDPRAAQLLNERRTLEARIDSLRGRRSSMSEEAYQRALEPLMIELAEKTRALRALEARKP
jgi:hypothetical protein